MGRPLPSFLPLGLLAAGGLLSVLSGGPTPARSGPGAALRPADAAVRRRVARAIQAQPLAFEAHPGRREGETRFLSRGAGYSLLISSSEAALSLSGTGTPRKSRSRLPGTAPAPPERGETVRMKLVGSRTRPRVRGERKLPECVNYFIGNDPGRWRTHVVTYAAVRQEGIYPGVDLVYYGNQRQVEYDFVVKPGADPSQIRLAYTGVEELRLDGRGDLLLETASGVVKQLRPRVYQEADGVREPVPASYRLCRGGEVTFDLGHFDRARELVIDPVLSYSTYLGGNSDDTSYAIAVDAAGNAYVAGYTTSTNFPTSHPYQTDQTGQDAFVTKISRTTLAPVFSTYLGGNGIDIAHDLAVDEGGSIYVTGETLSNNFPTLAAMQGDQPGPDAFIVKLSPSGSSLAYSSYLGGADNDFGYGVTVDAAGSAYVVGNTSSHDYPLFGQFQPAQGGFDAFVTKMTPAGTALAYSTYLGGSSDDGAEDVAVGPDGSAYVVGATASDDFPSEGGAQSVFMGNYDAFATRLAPSGAAVVFSTYLGGSGYDSAGGIAVDGSGDALIAGLTGSDDFPAISAFQSARAGLNDAFVTRLTADGASFVYSTYLGGSLNDGAIEVAVEEEGGAWVVGYTFSTNFPTANAAQGASGGEVDAFVTRLEPGGSTATFSSYLGGSNWDTGSGIARDRRGEVYVTGETGSGNFPTVDPYQTDQPAFDAFVTRLAVEPAPPTDLAATAAPTSVYLTWTDNSDTEGGFSIERKDGGGDFRRVRRTAPDEAEYLDTGVKPGTLYTYRVSAFVGTAAYSDYTLEVEVTTPAILGRPTNLALSAVSTTELKLTWTDNASGEQGFEVQRRKTGTSFARLKLLPANTLTHTDSGLEPGTKYVYRVRAYSGTHASRFSNQASRKTKRAPAPPSHLLAVPNDASTITLTWMDRSGTETGFRIERLQGADWISAGSVAANVTTFKQTGLTPATTYTFQVRAVSGGYVSAPSNSADAKTWLAPPAPGSLQVTSVTTTSVGLSWVDTSALETGFRIERSTDGVNFTTLTTRPFSPGSGTTQTYTDTSVAHLTTYSYRVRAISGTYASAPSNVVTASP
jgi:hypothetical protein